MIVQIHLKRSGGLSQRNKATAAVVIIDGDTPNKFGTERDYYHSHGIDYSLICCRNPTDAEMQDHSHRTWISHTLYKEWLILLVDEYAETKDLSWIEEIIQKANLPYSIEDVIKKSKSLQDKNKQYSLLNELFL